ncbi:hypothetical protein PsorP6_010650 [Peronosclerospora sorghi]|uniref:Uncharacterized protein n=1 Tax=Peronosclerospora sorghi TaxID=230839 RepID=A0ACC0VVT7_9STRA|nr:hypothetical protein PsorP6_010650 [Peronosclerospora sorghi]
MESRKQSHEVHDEADDQDGGDATVHWDTLAEAGAEQEQARSPDEDNWNALSNLRVATEVEGLDGSSDESREQKSRRRPSRDAPPPTRYPEDGNYSKSSLSFILDDHAASASGGNDDITSGNKQAAAVIARSRSTGDLTIETTSPVAMTSHDDFVPTAGANEGTSRTTSGKHQGTDGKRRARRPPSRICKHEGCEQYVVDQGLCVRHGVRGT